MRNLDTVLGLSITPTTVGWVLAEGHGADGIILDHHQLELCDGHGVHAVNTAEQVASEVLRAYSIAAAGGHRLRVIGVTWNDEASAQAALLLESLTDAGFDNVVPVRFLDAVERLALAIVPVVGYEQTAVCILDHEWATVVMVDIHDGETQTAVKHVRGGFDGVTSWLTGMYDRNVWRPAGVVVVGEESDSNSFSWQLEKALPVPVFTQTMMQVTVARGAAMAAAQSTEFTDAELVAEVSEPTAAPARSRRLSYTGALTALSAATVTFIASASLAVGLQLVPDKDPGTPQPVVHTSMPPTAEAGAPAVPPPSAPVASPPPAPPGEQAAHLPSSEPVDEATVPEERPSSLAPQQDPNNRPLLLTRVLDHMPGAYHD